MKCPLLPLLVKVLQRPRTDEDQDLDETGVDHIKIRPQKKHGCFNTPLAHSLLLFLLLQ